MVLLGVGDHLLAIAAWAGDWVPGGGLEGGDAVESDGADRDGLGAWDMPSAHAVGALLEFDLAYKLEFGGVCKCVHTDLLFHLSAHFPLALNKTRPVFSCWLIENQV
jgi:hypothetical protein